MRPVLPAAQPGAAAPALAGERAHERREAQVWAHEHPARPAGAYGAGVPQGYAHAGVPRHIGMDPAAYRVARGMPAQEMQNLNHDVYILNHLPEPLHHLPESRGFGHTPAAWGAAKDIVAAGAPPGRQALWAHNLGAAEAAAWAAHGRGPQPRMAAHAPGAALAAREVEAEEAHAREVQMEERAHLRTQRPIAPGPMGEAAHVRQQEAAHMRQEETAHVRQEEAAAAAHNRRARLQAEERHAVAARGHGPGPHFG